MSVLTLIQPGVYRDSVALMLLARELGALPGVSAVSVVMGTPANQAVLREAGLLTSEAQAASPNDLIIAIQAQDETRARAAMTQAQTMLAQKASSAQATGAARPRTMRSAIRALPEANVAVISVAGQYAAAQAWDALRAGLHVLLFSDHVSVDDEVALKEYAGAHDLLLMGPGAGTAILNGVGLGFANAVPRGDIGIVAAAGTGLQEVSTLIAKAGAGITQAIGTGGRDVSEKVGGKMLLHGLQMLQADPETRVIVVVSKLPADSVVDKLMAQVAQSDKPTVLALMTNYKLQMTNDKFATRHSPLATDLRQAASFAVALSRGESVDDARQKIAAEDRALAGKARALKRKLNARQNFLRGLYSGGTLCEETMRIWQAALGGIWSNAPLDPKLQLPDSNVSKRHTVIDLGEEEFTIGRPHPMIDQELRVKRILQEARDPRIAAIALDVVIGYGSNADPASELGAAIREAKQIAAQKKRELIFVASVTGTDSDPQNLARQTDTLKQAGVMVLNSNAAVARLTRALVE